MSGFFVSKVETHFPKRPVKFATSKPSNDDDDSSTTSIPEILKSSVPEFDTNYSFLINPLLSSGHTQTAYTALNKFDNQDKVNYKREIITIDPITYKLPNGEELFYDQWKGESTIALDYAIPKGTFKTDADHGRFKPESQTRELPPRTEYKNPEENLIDDSNDKPLLVVLHGLAGGSYEAYLRAVVDKIIEEPYGFDALVVNSRGCANHTITSPQLYNGLWTNDIRYVINEVVTKRWPNKKVYLMGFSLGAAICSNYLGQEGEHVPDQIKGSIVIACPWDFVESSYHLRDSIIGHYIYSPTMANNLLKLLTTHHILLANDLVKQYMENPEKYEVKFLKQFDDKFTAKLFGLNSADEYYRNASPLQRLLKVRVPTIILNSLDDPIVGSRSLPVSEINLNPYLTMVTTTNGGHIGWFTLNGARWYVEPVCKLFAELNKVDVIKANEEDLPIDISKGSWMYDRLVNGMLPPKKKL
ncbi:hypothetical protein Cantr_04258 [Candida viswanathii]|uniref:AB hydrolase-1 domain-containing protein n=1 Tax=Candida viswanathii TaxID=5486 RepID=A0A367XPD8_9ASCO|nr:hypothetical protein Cantr_04258 [Candida viswanathii]